MFEHGVTTVVVSPLRGLMAQQVARLQLQGVDAVAANSDASASDTKDLLERLGCTTGAPLRWLGVLLMAEYLSGTWA